MDDRDLARAELQAESLIATLGIERVLQKKPEVPTETEINHALKLPSVLKRRVADLVEATKQNRQASPPELPEYREMHEALANGIDVNLLTEMIAASPADMRPALTLAWPRAVALLNAKLPRRVEMRLSGPYLHDPSAGELGEWGWLWRIANYPLFALDLAAEGMLITAEVKGLQTLYPAIYAELCGDLQDAMADKVAADSEWQAPWWLRKQLCTLLRVSPVSVTLVADIDQAVQQSQAATKSRTSALKVSNPDSTPTQRLAER
jgi:hypothetical protein